MKKYEEYIEENKERDWSIQECECSGLNYITTGDALEACKLAQEEMKEEMTKYIAEAGAIGLAEGLSQCRESMQSEIDRLRKERDEALEREKIACKVIEEKRNGVIHMKKIDPDNLPEGKIIAKILYPYEDDLVEELEIGFIEKTDDGYIVFNNETYIEDVTHYLELNMFKAE